MMLHLLASGPNVALKHAPETIAQACYALGRAADTNIEARVDGADLGLMLHGRLNAQGASRKRPFCFSIADRVGASAIGR